MSEIKVFVSGCYDILHAGHVQFFEDSKRLGTHLTVSFASANVLWHHKKRAPSIPDSHKKVLISSLKMVDQVVIGSCTETKGLDFKPHFLLLKPQILAVTSDDLYSDLKKDLCKQIGATYIVLEKSFTLPFDPISTTSILKSIRAPIHVPLRVDFAGGWLDVPSLSIKGGYIVNCTISPLVDLSSFTKDTSSPSDKYIIGGGLGGSAAWAILKGEDAISSEISLGVGWQDPAAIKETGLCVWKSGPKPILEIKTCPKIFDLNILLFWSGQTHDTPSVTSKSRNYSMILEAGKLARDAVWSQDIVKLAAAVKLSYKIQLEEGMKEFDESILEVEGRRVEVLGYKYCGGGYGGYMMFLMKTKKEAEMLSKNMELYSYWRSSCSWRVRAALAYKNIDYKLIPVNLLKDEQSGEEYFAINSMKSVPSLKTSEGYLTQSIAILEYLEEKYPEPPLLPKDFHKRAKARAMAMVIAGDTQPLQNLIVMKKVKSVGGDEKEFIRWGIRRGLMGYEKMIEEGSKYSLGEDVSMGDFCIVPQWYNALRHGVEVAEFPRTKQVVENLQKLAYFTATEPTREQD